MPKPLLELMRERGISQGQLAKRAGLLGGPSTITRVLQRRRARLSTWQRIAAVLGVEVWEIEEARRQLLEG